MKQNTKPLFFVPNPLCSKGLRVSSEFPTRFCGKALQLVSRARPFTQSLRWERVWSNSHSGLVSTGPGISWTGNWFRVAVTSLYKQFGWIKIAREVFATRQLFSRGAARRKLLNRTSLTIKTSCPQGIQLYKDQLAMGV